MTTTSTLFDREPMGSAVSTPWAWRALACRTPLLWWTSVALVLASLVTLLAIGWDERQFNGINVWIKPWKFMVSAALHLITLAVCAAWWPLPQRARGLRVIEWVAVMTALFEVVYISWRASRGEASHFNIATPLAGAMYSLMGIAAVALTACAGVLGWGIWRERRMSNGIARALRTGIAVGLMLGFLLGTFTGGWMGASTSHWVGGTPSDAGGLMLFGWSRDGGDLRVAHFFGLHALQILPVWAVLAVRWLPSGAALRGFVVGAAGYTLLTLALFAQAVAGRPFL